MLITVQNFLLITIKRLGTWFSTSMYKSNLHTPAQKWTDYSTKQPGRTHINKKRTPAFAPPPQPKVPRFTETKLKTKSRRSISNTTSHTTNEDVPTLCQSNPDAEQTGKFRRGGGEEGEGEGAQEEWKGGRYLGGIGGGGGGAGSGGRGGAEGGGELLRHGGGASSRARVLTAPRRERERERARLSFRGGGGGGGGEGEGGGEASDSSRLLFMKGKCCTVE